MATDRLIHWICTETSHHTRSAVGLTRHKGRWALCPDLVGDDHQWVDTGGVDVQDAVRHWQRVRGAGAAESTAA